VRTRFGFLIFCVLTTSYFFMRHNWSKVKGLDIWRRILDLKTVSKTQEKKKIFAPFFYRDIGYHLPKYSKKSRNFLYTIELYKTLTRKKAVNFVSHLEKQGLYGYHVPSYRQGRFFYLVRQGVYRTKKEAYSATKKLKKSHGLQGKVIKL